MKSNSESLKELNFCIKNIKQSLKGEGTKEAREWAEKQLSKWERKKEKLQLLNK